MIALGIAAAIAGGALNGILLAEAMYGGSSAPARLLTDWADWVARRLTRG